MEAAESGIADQTAVECRDRPHLRMPLAKDASPFDNVHAFGICAEWSNLGPPTVVPVGTTVPTLMFEDSAIRSPDRRSADRSRTRPARTRLGRISRDRKQRVAFSSGARASCRASISDRRFK